MASYLDEAIAKLRQFEGAVPWMYLDTVGKVTVGVGQMLATESAASTLPFRVGEREATLAEIASEFARVSAMVRGKAAKFYRSKSGLMLSDAAIDQRLQGMLYGFEGYLRKHVAGYDALPDAAKLGLLDMVYNLGPGRLFAEYPRLIAAIERGDWKAAAAASARRGPGPARNDWTRSQFLDAARATVAEIKAEAEASRWSAMLLGSVTGIVAAAAVAVIFGEVDKAARRRRLRLER